MKILAIETSCDETAAAVVENGVKILSNVVVSQIDIFAAYGGVIPEVAARSHLEVIMPVVQKALDDAGLTKDEIDAIVVTHTPGLLGSLLIGTLTARLLAILWRKPLYAVHHLKSHIYANWLGSSSLRSISSSDRSSRQPAVAGVVRPAFSVVTCESSSDEVERCEELQCNEQRIEAAEASREKAETPKVSGMPELPLIALVVSGGHTQIIYMQGHNQFEIIGTTRDDAVGECFDKVAKILGLPYPGGPNIAKCAAGQTVGNPLVYRLPHPKVEGLDFSFSGLKTAVLRAVQAECGLPITTPSYELKNHLSEQQKADFAAAFQETASEILIERLEMALRQHPEAKSLVFAGGVSANQVLRQKALEAFSEAHTGKSDKKVMQKAAKSEQRNQENDTMARPVYFPEPKFAGDNAAMVGAAAYFEIISGVQPTDPYALNIAPRTSIEKA